MTCLEGGDRCFSEMLEAIRRSETRVWCESYIFDNSRIAGIFQEHLRDAALRGLDVVLLVDYIGAFGLRQARKNAMPRKAFKSVVAARIGSRSCARRAPTWSSSTPCCPRAFVWGPSPSAAHQRWLYSII